MTFLEEFKEKLKTAGFTVGEIKALIRNAGQKMEMERNVSYGDEISDFVPEKNSSEYQKADCETLRFILKKYNYSSYNELRDHIVYGTKPKGWPE